MAKSKSMTGIIIALSVLLVLSLTATIALAYFSASRTASTTITFDSGIVLNVTGITEDTQNTGVYYWNTDKGSAASVNAGSSPITLEQITVTVTGAPAYVAVKANINVTGGPDEQPTYGDNWTQVGEWYVYAEGGEKLAVSTSEVAVNAKTIGTPQTMNSYAGASYNCTLNVQASDTLAGLAELTGEAGIAALGA